MTSVMTSLNTSAELSSPIPMADLLRKNDGEQTASLSCRIPLEMKGDVMKAAAKERINVSQWVALVVERALDPKTSVMIGREELNQATEKAKALAKQVADLTSKLDAAIKANQGWSKSGENSKKSLSDAQKQLQAATTKIKELETRITAANKHIAADTFLGKPKQF